MAKGDKVKDADKQKRRAARGEEDHGKRGASAEKAGGHGESEDKAPYRKGGKGKQH